MRRGGGLVWAVGIAYLAGLVWLMVLAGPRVMRRAANVVYVQLDGQLPDRVQPVHFELLLNVLVFLPLGWLAQRATHRPVAYVMVASAWLAVMFEVVQVAVLDRHGSMVDVIATCAGAMIGAALGQVGEDRR